MKIFCNCRVNSPGISRLPLPVATIAWRTFRGRRNARSPRHDDANFTAFLRSLRHAAHSNPAWQREHGRFVTWPVSNDNEHDSRAERDAVTPALPWIVWPDFEGIPGLLFLDLVLDDDAFVQYQVCLSTAEFGTLGDC